MKRIHMVFFDAGGGHRSAAMALRQVIEEQRRPWELHLVNLQELFDSLDVFRQMTGVRSQDIYNITLKKGWTLGSPQLMRAMHGLIRLCHPMQVRILRDYWRANRPDLVVSLIPNFNRALYQGLQRSQPGTPMMTVMTDLADFPPHFWMERRQNQYIVCGSPRAVEQARTVGFPEKRILKASGMILNPRFYETVRVDRAEARARLGLRPELLTGLVLFGGQGSRQMSMIARRLQASGLPVQLILICGHNEKLAAKLREREWRMPVHIEGFTREIPHLMRVADFFIGKPGPGSISEALHMRLPVIVEKNAWTLPQERFNAEWVSGEELGVVLPSFKNIEDAVRQMLVPETFERFRKNAARMENRAVFEIPEMMDQVLSGAERQNNAEALAATARTKALR